MDYRKNKKKKPQPTELRKAALHWLVESDPAQKSIGVRLLWDAWLQRKITLDATTKLKGSADLPGRPELPKLVSPKAVEKRTMNSREGRATLIHALTHIEFSAINLALDILWRFPNMPVKFYADWLKVAKEESLHFSLLNNHMRSMGYKYGDFTAHDALWEMAEITKTDLLARLAIVPRTMEARGLDVGPEIREKLSQAGDKTGAAILDIILRDEIGHVSIGNFWFEYLCKKQEVNVVDTYQQLLDKYNVKAGLGKLNIDARLEAGFTSAELQALLNKET